MTTEERLETLEKELTRAKRRNRRLLAVVGLAAGAFALVWIVPGTDTARAVAGAGTANRVEAQGSGVPAVIHAGQFVLVDASDKRRAALGVSTIGPALYLFDENGKTRVKLVVATDGPSLTLLDENGKQRAQLGVFKHRPGLTLLDENGKIRAELGVSKVGPALNLWDENSRRCAKLGAMQAETPEGKIITYPELSLVLFGADGKVIWKTP